MKRKYKKIVAGICVWVVAIGTTINIPICIKAADSKDILQEVEDQNEMDGTERGAVIYSGVYERTNWVI